MKALLTVLMFAASLYCTGGVAYTVADPDCSHGPQVVGKLEDGSPVYLVECGISPPRVVYQVEPEFSDKARKKKITGTVTLSGVIGTDGSVSHVKIEHSVDAGLDREATATFRKWKFKPATRDGQPVAIKTSVEMNFQLY